MKKTKRGFTIVELVVVIAVIAILSAVMIPTFSNVTDNAKKSAALQEASTALTTVIAEEDGQLDSDYDYYFISGNYWFTVEEGKLTATNKPNNTTVVAGDVIYANGSITLSDYSLLLDAQADISDILLDVADLGKVVVWKDYVNP